MKCNIWSIVFQFYSRANIFESNSNNNNQIDTVLESQFEWQFSRHSHIRQLNQKKNTKEIREMLDIRWQWSHNTFTETEFYTEVLLRWIEQTERRRKTEYLQQTAKSINNTICSSNSHTCWLHAIYVEWNPFHFWCRRAFGILSRSFLVTVLCC